MDKLHDSKEYNDLVDKYNNFENEIDFYEIRMEELEKYDEGVQKYLECKKMIADIKKKQKRIYKKGKFLEYSMCNHIIVCSKVKNDYREGRKYKEHTCIHCGLTDAVINKEKEELTISDKIMLKYLNQNALRGEYIDVVCDPNKAKHVWSEIKKKHPKITDKELATLFKESISDINVSEKIKKKK